MASILVFAILKHFVPKKVNFPEGMGFFFLSYLWKIQRGEGGGGVTVFLKKWKIRGGGGGSLVNFRPWWGYGYFLEPRNTQK